MRAGPERRPGSFRRWRRPRGPKRPEAAGDDGLTFQQIAAILLVEPYNLSLADIAQLTDWQLRWLLFPPRDDEHRPLSIEQARAQEELERDEAGGSAPDYATYRDWFFGVWRLRKETDAQIEKRWREYLKTDPAEAAAEKEREAKKRG